VAPVQAAPDQPRLRVRGEEGREEDVAGAGRVDHRGRGNGRPAAEVPDPAAVAHQDRQAAPVALGDAQGRARFHQCRQRLERDVRVEVVAADPDQVRPLDQRRSCRRVVDHPLAGHELAQQALPGHGHECLGRDRVSPLVSQLARDGGEDPRARRSPGPGQGGDGQPVGAFEAALDPPAGRLEVVEHRSVVEGHEAHVGPGQAEQVELGGPGRGRIDADERTGGQPEPGDRQGAVRDAASQAPAAPVVGGVVAGRSADHDDQGRAVRDTRVGHRSTSICTSPAEAGRSSRRSRNPLPGRAPAVADDPGPVA